MGSATIDTIYEEFMGAKLSFKQNLFSAPINLSSILYQVCSRRFDGLLWVSWVLVMHFYSLVV